MDFLIPDLEKNYGIKPRSVIKSKYFYIIAAGNKLYRLYPFAQSPEQAQQLFQLNKSALLNGVSVCPVVQTVDKQPCSEFEEQLFMLTTVPKGREVTFDCAAEFLKVVTLVARFHNQLKKHILDGDCPILPYEKGVNTLVHIKGIINRKNKLSEIDKLFMKNYSAIHSLAVEAMDKLKGCDLQCTYSYGNFKEENFIFNTINSDVTLTNWSNLYISHFLCDLAYLIKRYYRKCTVKPVDMAEIVACYTKENPLSKNEITALYSILAYPEKYISILKEYYGKHRPFAPLYVKEKLLKELSGTKFAQQA